MTDCPITDFHTHILPGIDDGSPNVEVSLQMLRELAGQGVGRVVATPHFYANYNSPERFLRKRAAAIEELTEAVREKPNLPQLCYGAEVYFFNGISECEALPELAISGTKCLLLEMPFSRWSDSMYRQILQIHERFGLIPVIAHVDRYLRPFRTNEVFARLSELPVVVQANADFFTERSSRRKAIRLLKDGHIHLLGSDCHNMTNRKPNLGQARQIIAEAAGDAFLQQMQVLEADLLGGL